MPFLKFHMTWIRLGSTSQTRSVHSNHYATQSGGITVGVITTYHVHPTSASNFFQFANIRISTVLGCEAISDPGFFINWDLVLEFGDDVANCVQWVVSNAKLFGTRIGIAYTGRNSDGPPHETVNIKS